MIFASLLLQITSVLAGAPIPVYRTQRVNRDLVERGKATNNYYKRANP